MEIFEHTGSFGDAVKKQDIEDIKADGITIRIGNKVVTLAMTGEETLPADDLESEYKDKLDEAYTNLQAESATYKGQLKQAYQVKADQLEKEIREYERKSARVSILPDIKVNHVADGLSVASESNGIAYFFNCVYAPKYINEARIDPAFAKRLMTPITIKISLDSESKIHDIRLLKIIGHGKFQHYHSLSDSSDCWGDFHYAGERIRNPDEAIAYARKTLMIVATINEFSLGKRNPKGLSRFSTLKKHVIKSDEKVVEKKTAVNSRNARSGFDTDVNDDVSDATVWST